MNNNEFIIFLKKEIDIVDVKDENGNLIVNGNLDLSNTQITELPDNLTVDGFLDLSDTQIKKLPNNLTIGGFLDLSNTQIKELPNNLMVQYSIFGYNGDDIIKVKKVEKGYNKERNYIYFDGILWGNVKSVKKRENITMYKTPLGYCTEENGITAHGKTLKESLNDLIYKKTCKKDVKEIINKIKETGKVNRADYRALTGACSFGTEQFCIRHNIENLEEIELEKILELLSDNDYGAEQFKKLIDD